MLPPTGNVSLQGRAGCLCELPRLRYRLVAFLEICLWPNRKLLYWSPKEAGRNDLRLNREALIMSGQEHCQVTGGMGASGSARTSFLNDWIITKLICSPLNLHVYLPRTVKWKNVYQCPFKGLKITQKIESKQESKVRDLLPPPPQKNEWLVCKTMWGEVGSNEGMKIVKGGW
jgi:hypothetical protein